MLFHVQQEKKKKQAKAEKNCPIEKIGVFYLDQRINYISVRDDSMPNEQRQQQLVQQIRDLLEINDKPALKKLLAEQRSSDIAEVVELLDNEQNRIVFDVLDEPTAAQTLEKVEEATRAELFDVLKDQEINKLIAELDLDDAADLLAELPEEVRQKVLKKYSAARFGRD